MSQGEFVASLESEISAIKNLIFEKGTQIKDLKSRLRKADKLLEFYKGNQPDMFSTEKEKPHGSSQKDESSSLKKDVPSKLKGKKS